MNGTLFKSILAIFVPTHFSKSGIDNKHILVLGLTIDRQNL